MKRPKEKNMWKSKVTVDGKAFQFSSEIDLYFISYLLFVFFAVLLPLNLPEFGDIRCYTQVRSELLP